MCLAVPGRVTSIWEQDDTPMGQVDFGGVTKEVCLAYVPDLQVGEYTIVHVGFALQRLDEESALETLELFRQMGELDAEFGDHWGRAADRVRDAPAGRHRRHGSRRDRRTGDDAMKYLEEFSDPELARRLLDDIHRTATQPWAMMEVCGGQTHSIIRHGLDQLLPDGIELIHGPGCPVCVTPLEMIDKALEIASRPDVIFCSFGDMLRVPGSDKDLFRVKSAGGDVRVVYSPMDALAIARANPAQAGGVLRDRLRDHRTAQRDDGARGEAARHRELQPAGQPRPGAPRDRGDHDRPGVPGAGVPRGRPRVHGDGHRGVPGAHREVPGADRGHRLRAARHPRGHPARRPPARGGPARARERLRPRGLRRRQPDRAPDARRRVRGRRPELARHRHDPAERLAALGEVSGVRRRAPVRGRPASTPTSRRSAAAARCSRGCSSPTSARRSAPRARRATRSAPRWCPARAPARRTTSTAG